MNKTNNIKRLYEISDNFSKKIVSCNGCTKCCESGIAYALPEEVDHLKSIGVPLIEFDGINYLKRDQRGACSMLDKQHHYAVAFSL